MDNEVRGESRMQRARLALLDATWFLAAGIALELVVAHIGNRPVEVIDGLAGLVCAVPAGKGFARAWRASQSRPSRPVPVTAPLLDGVLSVGAMLAVCAAVAYSAAECTTSAATAAFIVAGVLCAAVGGLLVRRCWLRDGRQVDSTVTSAATASL